jgi:NAD(P)-dependent dehydrogenase (short-subunit alcohol dehydrogenase family)
MAGKTCLVTGATSGIGRVTALELARLGAAVVVVGRADAKSAAVVREIKQETGNPEVRYVLADLSSQQEIRQLADRVTELYPRLDVLVNNAGAINLFRQLSLDGIELTLALNHLNYFLLTNLLLDMLKANTPSRIVNVSSSAHRGASIDFDDLQSQAGYRGFHVYARSKLANLLFTYELARRLEGTGVTSNALHPGLVATNLLSNNGFFGKLCNFGLRVKGISKEKGADTAIYLATSPEVEGITGQYFEQRRPIRSSGPSYDVDAAARLWRVSTGLTSIVPY